LLSIEKALLSVNAEWRAYSEKAASTKHNSRRRWSLHSAAAALPMLAASYSVEGKHRVEAALIRNHHYASLQSVS